MAFWRWCIVGQATNNGGFWERNSLSINVWNESFLLQKMNYIHKNPVHAKWKLAVLPQDYKYSSALFYETGKDEFGFLTHYRG